jgi:hypothetical protein
MDAVSTKQQGQSADTPLFHNPALQALYAKRMAQKGNDADQTKTRWRLGLLAILILSYRYITGKLYFSLLDKAAAQRMFGIVAAKHACMESLRKSLMDKYRDMGGDTAVLEQLISGKHIESLLQQNDIQPLLKLSLAELLPDAYWEAETRLCKWNVAALRTLKVSEAVKPAIDFADTLLERINFAGDLTTNTIEPTVKGKPNPLMAFVKKKTANTSNTPQQQQQPSLTEQGQTTTTNQPAAVQAAPPTQTPGNTAKQQPPVTEQGQTTTTNQPAAVQAVPPTQTPGNTAKQQQQPPVTEQGQTTTTNQPAAVQAVPPTQTPGNTPQPEPGLQRPSPVIPCRAFVFPAFINTRAARYTEQMPGTTTKCPNALVSLPLAAVPRQSSKAQAAQTAATLCPPLRWQSRIALTAKQTIQQKRTVTVPPELLRIFSTIQQGQLQKALTASFHQHPSGYQQFTAAALLYPAITQNRVRPPPYLSILMPAFSVQ